MKGDVYVETKSLPDSLQRALRSVGYGRADIRVQVSETYSQCATSGTGRRGFVMAVNLATGERQTQWGSWGGGNPFGAPNPVDNDTTPRQLAPGFAVVSGNEGGNTVYATLILNPQNAAPLLPAKAELSERLGHLLDVFGSLTSAGRKNHFERKRNAPTEAELVELVSRGLITRNRAGAVAITTAGRNARPGKSVY